MFKTFFYFSDCLEQLIIISSNAIFFVFYTKILVYSVILIFLFLQVQQILDLVFPESDRSQCSYLNGNVNDGHNVENFTNDQNRNEVRKKNENEKENEKEIENENENRNGNKNDNVSPFAQYLQKEEGAAFVSIVLQLSHATGEFRGNKNLAMFPITTFFSVTDIFNSINQFIYLSISIIFTNVVIKIFTLIHTPILIIRCFARIGLSD